MAEGENRKSASAKRLLSAAEQALARAQATAAGTEAKTGDALKERERLLRRENEAVESEYRAVSDEVDGARKRATAAEKRAVAARNRAQALRQDVDLPPAERARKVKSADRSSTNADAKARAIRSEVTAGRDRMEELAARRSQVQGEQQALMGQIERATLLERQEQYKEGTAKRAAKQSARTAAAADRAAAAADAAATPPAPKRRAKRTSKPAARTYGPERPTPQLVTQSYIQARERADAITYARRQPYRYDNPAVVAAQRSRLIEQYSLSETDLTGQGQAAANEAARAARAAAARYQGVQGALPGIGQAGQGMKRATKPALGTKPFQRALEKLRDVPTVQLDLLESFTEKLDGFEANTVKQLESAADRTKARAQQTKRAARQAKPKPKPTAADPLAGLRQSALNNLRRAALSDFIFDPEFNRAEIDDAKELERRGLVQRSFLTKRTPKQNPRTGFGATVAGIEAIDTTGELRESRAEMAQREIDGARTKLRRVRRPDQKKLYGDLVAMYERDIRMWEDFQTSQSQVTKAAEQVVQAESRAAQTAKPPAASEVTRRIAESGMTDRQRRARQKRLEREATIAAQREQAEQAAQPSAPKPAPKPPARVTVRPRTPPATEGVVAGNEDAYKRLIRENAELLARGMDEGQRRQFQQAVSPTPPERQERALGELKTAVDRNTEVQARGEEIGRGPGTDLIRHPELRDQRPAGPFGRVYRSRVEGEINAAGGARSPLAQIETDLKAAQDAASDSARVLRNYNRDTTKYTLEQSRDFERTHAANTERVAALRASRNALARDIESTIANTQASNLAERARTEAMLAAAAQARGSSQRALRTIETTATDIVEPPGGVRRSPIPDSRALVRRAGEQIGDTRAWYSGQNNFAPPERVANLAEVRYGGFGGGGFRGGSPPPPPPTPPTPPTPPNGPGNRRAFYEQSFDEVDAKRFAQQDREIASSLRESEEAMRRWNAQLGISDQAMRKHGTFTTEFIEAARKGDVAYREWGWQIGAAAAKFGAWTAAGAGIYAAIGAVGKIGQGAVDSDSGVPSVQRTIPNLDAGEAQKQFRSLSTEFAVPISDASDAMMRMGAVFRDQSEAFTAARAALLAFRTGEVDTATATTQLTAVATGMGASADDLIDIFDRLNYVQNNYNVRIPDLLTATSRLSAAWRQAGGDADYLVALITEMNRTAGVSGAQAATIIGRSIGKVQAPGNKATLESFGISVTPGDFETTIKQAVAVAQKLGPEARQQIAKALGGGNEFLRQWTAVLQDPAILNKLVEEFGQGKQAGASQTELGKVMETWQMRLAEIGAQLGNLGSNLAQSGFLTGLGLGVALMTTMLKTVNRVLEVFNELPGPLKTGVASMLTLVGLLRLARRLGLGGAFAGRFSRFGGMGDRVAPFLNESAGRTARRNVSKGLNDAVKVYQDDFERTTRTARAANVTRDDAVRRAEAERQEIRARMALDSEDPRHLTAEKASTGLEDTYRKQQRAVDRAIDAEIAQTNAANRLKGARDDLAAFERDQARGPRRERNQRALQFANQYRLYGPASLPRDQPSAEQVRRYGVPTAGGLPTFFVTGARPNKPGRDRNDQTAASAAAETLRTARQGGRYTGDTGDAIRKAGNAASYFARRTEEAADQTVDAAGAAAKAARDAAHANDYPRSNLSAGNYDPITGQYDPSRGPAAKYEAPPRRPYVRGQRPNINRVTADITDEAYMADIGQVVGSGRARRLRQRAGGPTTGPISSARQRLAGFQQRFDSRSFRENARSFRENASSFGSSALRLGQTDVGAAAGRARAKVSAQMGKAASSLKGMAGSFGSIISPAELLVTAILSLPAVFLAIKGALDKDNDRYEELLSDPKTPDEIKDRNSALKKASTDGASAGEYFKNLSYKFYSSDNLLDIAKGTVPLDLVKGIFGKDNDFAKRRQAEAKAMADAQKKLEEAQKRAREAGRDVPELTSEGIDHDLSIVTARYQAGRATIDDAVAATQKALREIDKTSKLSDEEKTDKRESLLNDLAQLNKEKQDKVQEEIDAQNQALAALVQGGAATSGQLMSFINKQVGLINQFRGDTTAEGMQKYADARQNLINTLKNTGSGDSLEAALTNAQGDPRKIEEAYRQADKEFQDAYRAAKGATRVGGGASQTGLLGGLRNGLGPGRGGGASTADLGQEADPELAAQLKAIKRQRDQARFEYMRAIAEAQTEVRAGNVRAGVPRAQVQLRGISRLVQQAIRVYGRNAKETLGLVAQQQQAEAAVVQEQASLITARADYAASGESTEAGAAQKTIAGLQELLAFQQANPEFGEADILATKTRLRDARKGLAEQIRQQAVDLLDARYELLESQTDDPVEQAKLEAEHTAAILKRGGFTNAADKMRAQAAANTAKRTAQNAAVQAQLDDIDFDVEIGKMSRDQQIAAYERLLKTAKMSQQMKKQLRQQIERLKHDAENDNDGAFELGLDKIRVPTMYEVARLIKGGPDSVTSPVTNANTVNVTINGQADYEELGRVLEKHIKGTGKATARAAQMR